MKWIVAPLAAAFILVTSGFLAALEDTTDASTDLAAASESAPQTTAEAARGVGSLPKIARLTAQQSNALGALADALAASAERVEDLNGSLARQSEELGDLEGGLREVLPQITCIENRIGRLRRASSGVSPSLNAITDTLRRLIASQNKSIRHTRSINRKLTALGVAAGLQGVEPPPPPSGAPEPGPGVAPPGRPCRP
ncbi:MAG: hypothetical protein ACRDLB_13910 [Actinomycetota bacterium]